MGTLDTFREAFGEGQRVSQFRVSGAFASNSGASSSLTYAGGDLNEIFVKSAQFPSSNIGTIEIPWRGRKIKMPGDRTFNEWTISVSMDDEHQLHAAFTEWSNSLNSHTNVESAGVGTNLKNDWTITALGADGVPNGSDIIMVGCWPSEVGTVDFNWETTDTIAEFSVTMQFDYWTSASTT